MTVLRLGVPRRPLLTVAGARTSVLGEGAGNAGLNVATLLFNFATTLLLSRLLGASGFGTFAFAYALAMVLSVPAVLGLTPLLVREIAQYRMDGSFGAIRGINRRANETVLAASLFVCLVAALVFWIAGWPEGQLHLASLLALPLVPLVAVTSVRQSVMQGFGKVVLGRAPEAAISPAVLVVGAGALALVLEDSFSASWAIGVADLAALSGMVVGVALLRRVLPFEVAVADPVFETRRWARGAVPLVVFSLVSVAGFQLPTVLLGALGTPADVGVYNVAARIANVLPFLLVAVMPALMPAIAELNALGQHEELQRTLSRSSRLVLLGSLPMALGALVLAGPLLGVFGADFGGGEAPLRILAIGQLVNIACGLPGTVLVMVGEANVMATTFALTTASTIALSAVLIPSFGAVGAAAASALGTAGSNLALSVILWRRRGVFAPALGSGSLPSARSRIRAWRG